MFIGNWQDLAPILTAVTGVIATAMKVAQYLKSEKGKERGAAYEDDLETKVENLTSVCMELLSEINALKKMLEEKNNA